MVTTFSVWLIVIADPKNKTEKLKSTVWAGIFSPPPENEENSPLLYAKGVPISEEYVKSKTLRSRDNPSGTLASDIHNGNHRSMQGRRLHFKRTSACTPNSGKLAVLVNGFKNFDEAAVFATFLCMSAAGSVSRATRAYAMCELFSDMLYRVYIDWSTVLNVRPRFWRFLTLGNKLYLVKTAPTITNEK